MDTHWRPNETAAAVLANGSFAVSLLSVEDRGYAEAFLEGPGPASRLSTAIAPFRASPITEGG